MAGKPKKPKKATGKEAPKQVQGRAASRQPFARLPSSLDVRRVGRPTKYDPSFCDLVIELGAEGKSKTQIAASLGVDRDTLLEWTKAHPEFSVAVKRAAQLAQAWWEDLGQMNVTRQGFNAVAFIFQMKNRFPADYKDKHEISGDPENPIVTRTERVIVRPPN